MSKEAMKLALEALEFIPKSGSMLGSQAETKRLQAIAVMKETLVMQQLSEPCRCGKQTNAWCMANTCSKAQQALDKKAEQPAQQQNGPINEGWQITVAHGHSGYGVYAHMEDYPEEGAVLVQAIEQPAQQEPVAYWIPKAKQFCIAGPSGRPFAKAWEALYISPPAQRTWVEVEQVKWEGDKLIAKLKENT